MNIRKHHFRYSDLNGDIDVEKILWDLFMNEMSTKMFIPKEYFKNIDNV
jgi:hypothetical protein